MEALFQSLIGRLQTIPARSATSAHHLGFNPS